ncbi:MAG: putative spermidine/putrescine transport system ATP-binding protein [Actinomycetota bacterium]|nr:putative spermidine/putrescine transport system ATP-binding protein [Actinomycetota bacterium]
MPEPALVDDVSPGSPSRLPNGVAVSLRGVTKRFGALTAVDGVDLDIAEGEFFSMLGPSGSGKTTMLRMIAGFELPSAGTVLLKGRDVTRLPPFDRDVNTVFQDYALFPHMSVAQNVAYGLRVRRVPKPERTRRVDEALATVRLDDFGSRRPHQLSGGQRQRVALARALVNRPAVLLLDEPLGALDLKLREEMQVELKGIQQDVGITFIFVTHDQQEALTMSDRIAVFAEGRVEQVGTPVEIYERPTTQFVAGFVGTSNVLSPELARALTGRDETSTIRPEHIRIVAPGSVPTADEMHTAATVRDVQYLGAFVRVRTETADAARMVVDVPTASETLAEIVPGRECTLAWRAESVRAVGATKSTNTGGAR